MKARFRVTSALPARLRQHARDTAVQARRQLADDLHQTATTRLIDSTPVRSGRLRQSWADAASGGGPDATADRDDTAGTSTRTARSHVPYARYVEYGTARRQPQRLVAAALRHARRLARSLFRFG